ncbi:EAL and HDOD domain-containing protein [Variovorax sp. PBL-E5]|uniref:EAL and HDOD domain-containing protein n=1 Tax=Variovorax sp. PBL-E5 TaxID=434014 RepID=UPI001319AB8A|nr:HDOD domain-containing protein [Variovorax sp. PBL-E5]VTU33285.1 HDOD domain protein [Variovorax sp. PBL-E5]
MRFDFFRRQSEGAVVHDGSGAPPRSRGDAPGQAGYLSATPLLDPQKQAIGYRLAWCAAPGGEAAGTAAHLRALLACVAMHLNDRKTGWRLGRTALFLDIDADSLLLDELQSLPPENVVLCVGPEDFAQPDVQGALLFLREQGYGVMLCRSRALPIEAELRGLVTHFDVGSGAADIVAEVRGAQVPGTAPVRLIATQIANWEEFAACAARRLEIFVGGAMAPPQLKKTDQVLQPESLLIMRLMQMIRRNDDVREIESALKHDAVLTYQLLRHINSPAIGVGVEIHSLRHAVSMLGYSPLFRWLSLLLATSNARTASPYLMKQAILRGRFVELMGQGMLAAGDADNLFVVGMFSLIDQLLGVPMEEVLAKVQLAESVQQAILARGGIYGPFLALAETCERDARDAARLSEALFLSAEQVNAAHLWAMAWTQGVNTSEAPG